MAEAVYIEDLRTSHCRSHLFRKTLRTSLGIPLTLLTIWQIDHSTGAPRLITLYPDSDSEVRMADFIHYQDVVLLRDIPEEGLCAGDVVTVVERHDVPGREPGDSVEFFDLLGNTIAVVTLPACTLRAPTHSDCPTVRE